jgi:hypothetical protein
LALRAQSAYHSNGMRGPFTRKLLLVGVAVVAVLGAALLEVSPIHTDDGCPLEVHCVICRLLLSTPAIVAAALVPVPPALGPADPVAVLSERLEAESTPSRAPSRAPPLT